MGKIKALLLIGMFTAFLGGCARIDIVDTGHSRHAALVPTVARDIVIYRSQRPQWPFEEMGLVSVKGMSNIKFIYKDLRQAASAKGAHGVIDFDLESQEVTTSSTSTSCTPQGACTTSTNYTTSIEYVASGTLILRSRA